MGNASFIYDLYNNSNLPWVYGGEYFEFMNLAKTVVQAWIKVGLQVYFVFDGMWILKLYASTTPHLESEIQVHARISSSQLLYRASASLVSSLLIFSFAHLPPQDLPPGS